MSTAAYAVSVSMCDASMIETLLHGRPAPGGVTSVQLRPPSRVTWISPSSVPTQILFASRSDGAIV